MDGRDIDEDDNDDQVHIMTNGALVSKSCILLRFIDKHYSICYPKSYVNILCLF